MIKGKSLVVLVVVFLLVCVLMLNVSAANTKADFDDCFSPYPKTSAGAYILINADTGYVIAGNNYNNQLPMASTTKIMTALILAENGELDTEIVTTKEMVTVEGSSMGLLEGDTVSYYGLLCGMLLPSGNDAANTTAIALGGTVDNFVQIMNERAAQLGMNNTHFSTPSGLDADDHYSTAYDMAILAAAALKNQSFSEIVSSPSLTVCYGNPPYNRTLSNHNKLLKSYQWAIGIKTGYTKKSGRCLVSAARKDGCTLIAVTLNDPNDWDDHTSLFEYGFSQVASKDNTVDLSNVFLNVVGGVNDKVSVQTDNVVVGLSNEEKDLTAETEMPMFLYAPIKKQQCVGKVYYRNDLGDLVYTKSIYTTESVEQQEVVSKTYWLKFTDCLSRYIGLCV